MITAEPTMPQQTIHVSSVIQIRRDGDGFAITFDTVDGAPEVPPNQPFPGDERALKLAHVADLKARYGFTLDESDIQAYLNGTHDKAYYEADLVRRNGGVQR